MIIKRNDRKAHSFVWLYVIVSIFGMGLLFVLFNQPMNTVSDYMADNLTGSQYADTYTKLNGIWDYWLVIFLVGIILYGVLTTMRRDQYGY